MFLGFLFTSICLNLKLWRRDYKLLMRFCASNWISYLSDNCIVNRMVFYLIGSSDLKLLIIQLSQKNSHISFKSFFFLRHFCKVTLLLVCKGLKVLNSDIPVWQLNPNKEKRIQIHIKTKLFEENKIVLLRLGSALNRSALYQ